MTYRTPFPYPDWSHTVTNEPARTSTCEGCRGFGGNWDCMGENDPEDCNCENCTGSDRCPECGE